LKGKAIINATGVFTNAIMKLNDTVYKKYIVPSQEFILYLINLPSDHALMIPKKVMESSICALAQQNSSRNNRYSSEKHSLEPILRN
jgi:glycerol-3-phosphate dehydrogenase